MKKYFSLLTKFVTVVACSLISLFIYLNVFEKVSLLDLPYVNSVTKTEIPSVIYQVRYGINIDEETAKYGFYGKPLVIRVPMHNYSLSIGEEKKHSNYWIVSNGVGSYHIFEESQGGNIGRLVVFAAPKSGLLAVADILTEGNRIVIDTDKGWRYNYRVISRQFVSTKTPYLLSSSEIPQLIVVRDRNYDEATLIIANLLSVEERGVF
jgi:hypothetical protein